MLLIDGIVLGLAAGLLAGGSLRNLAAVHLKGETLMVMLLALQLSIPAATTRLDVPKTPALAVWLLCMSGLVFLALWNRHAPGMLVAGLGIALNVLVIGLNSSMPVSLEAIRFLDAAAHPSFDLLHSPLAAGALLPFLADVIPIPGPSWHRGVASVGDVLLTAGIAFFLFSSLRQEQHRR